MSEFRNYLIEYRFEGAEWGTTIQATSFEDAKRRIETVGAFGRVKGTVVMAVPAAGGPFVRLFVRLANLWRRP